MMSHDRIGERLEAFLPVKLHSADEAIQFYLDGLLLELYLLADQHVEVERHIADMAQRWAGVG